MKQPKPLSFREQMRMSLRDLQSIVERGESPTGNGRFTVRTIEITEPSAYSAKGVRQVRRTTGLSQALFARLVGVSASLVRSWEIGTREPSPMARRLLDQVRAEPRRFLAFVRETVRGAPKPGRKAGGSARSRRVA